MVVKPIYWIAALCACGSSAPSASLIEGGNLISIDEGQIKTFHLTSGADLSGQPPWVRVDGQDLIVDLASSAGCSVVPTTVGPPKLFTFLVGGERVYVEVQPSGEGLCRPTLRVAYKKLPRDQCPNRPDAWTMADDLTWDMIQSHPIRVDDDHISVALSQQDANRIIGFELDNPDTTDTQLQPHFVSDAATHIQEIDNATVCQELPNFPIVGQFTESWTISRKNESTHPTDWPVVSTGSYRLSWNTDAVPYGIQLTGCAGARFSPTKPDSCNLETSSTGWVVRKACQGTAVVTGKIWATTEQPLEVIAFRPTTTNGQVDAHITSAIAIGDGRMPLAFGQTAIPIDFTVDLGTRTEDLHVGVHPQNDAGDQNEVFISVAVADGNCP